LASVVGFAVSAEWHHASHQQGWSDEGGTALKMEETEAKHEDRMALFKKDRDERKNVTQQESE